LGGMPEKRDDALNGLFHAVEPGKCRVDPDSPVQKYTAKAGVLGRIDHLRLTDRRQQAFRSVGISHRVAPTRFQILGH
jgi:hypothetical protein